MMMHQRLMQGEGLCQGFRVPEFETCSVSERQTLSRSTQAAMIRIKRNTKEILELQVF